MSTSTWREVERYRRLTERTGGAHMPFYEEDCSTRPLIDDLVSWVEAL
jgi:hypothetical protein